MDRQPLAEIHGEEESLLATGRSTLVTSTYACRLRYLYHCYHCTTLGPELLAAALPSWAPSFLDKWSRVQKFIVFRGPMILAMVVLIVLSQTRDKVPFEVPVIFSMGVALLALVYVCLDVVLFFCVDIPLFSLHGLGTLIPTSDDNIGNEFYTYRRTEFHATVDAYVNQSELAVLIRARMSSGELKCMIYGPTWDRRFFGGIYRLLNLKFLGFWAPALLQTAILAIPFVGSAIAFLYDHLHHAALSNNDDPTDSDPGSKYPSVFFVGMVFMSAMFYSWIAACDCVAPCVMLFKLLLCIPCLQQMCNAHMIAKSKGQAVARIKANVNTAPRAPFLNII